MYRPVSFALLFLATLASCDGCSKKKTEKKAEKRGCSADLDCDDENPCTKDECSDEECVRTPLPEGESCENETVCDGIATCDGDGRCLAGVAPALDDQNGCTTDACDPVKGVSHVPVAVDDQDACTTDACDPRTGEVTHQPIDLDDGDDCSFDSCDPLRGVQHKKPDAFHTCDASCGTGFHVSSRAKSPQCRDQGGLQTFCAPDCGPSFYRCDGACPTGYHASSRRTTGQCGPDPTTQTFCQKNTGDSFYSCDGSCPEGYKKKSEGPNTQCGPSSQTQIFCLKP